LQQASWVRTDLVGLNADLSVGEGVHGIADAIARRAANAGLHYVNYRGDNMRW
jgi:hypothetical protein